MAYKQQKLVTRFGHEVQGEDVSRFAMWRGLTLRLKRLPPCDLLG